jgi:hypothetical protein
MFASRKQFRLKIEKNPNLSLCNIHGEYWLLHVNSPSTSGQHSYQTGQQQTYLLRIYTQNKMQLSSNQVNPQNNIIKTTGPCHYGVFLDFKSELFSGKVQSAAWSQHTIFYRRKQFQ